MKLWPWGLGLAAILVLIAIPQYLVYVAKLQGIAETERARGVAEANQILAKSINDQPNLINYLFVRSLEQNRRTIYVPTENNLPVLEATRFQLNK